MQKPNDQTIKADAGKAKLSLVPPAIIYDIAKVREYGNKKYPEGGKDNWKRVEPQRYIDAAYRHLLAFTENPKSIDEESGLEHLWHLACNIAFLCELENEQSIDDTIIKCKNCQFSEPSIMKGQLLCNRDGARKVYTDPNGFCHRAAKERNTND